jgi:maleate isomerase
VSVFTPYAGPLTRTVADCIAEAGLMVVTATGMGLLDNTEIGRVEPERIVDFVTDRMRGVYPDAVFLSCTNWRAMEAIDPLTEALGLPVLTSNQVTLEAVERRLS